MAGSVADPTVGATPGAEDGSQPSGDSTVDSTLLDSGAAGDGTGPDDDDVDEEDYSDVPFHEHPRFKALTKKLSKAKRQLQKFRPIAERVKDVDVDELRTKARTSDQLQDVLARDPKLRQQVLEALARPAAAADDADDEPDFDPNTLPFDVTDESGKFFAAQVKKTQDLEKTVKTLVARLNGLNETSAREQRATEAQTWRGAVKAAEAQVPESFRDMFHDAVYGAFREAKQRGIVIDPVKVITHYVSKIGVNKGTQQAATAAAAQRVAEANKTLPRQPANAGASADAKGDRKETVADVSRRYKKLYGG